MNDKVRIKELETKVEELTSELQVERDLVASYLKGDDEASTLRKQVEALRLCLRSAKKAGEELSERSRESESRAFRLARFVEHLFSVLSNRDLEPRKCNSPWPAKFFQTLDPDTAHEPAQEEDLPF